MFYETYPFGNYANDLMEIYRETLYNNISFPRFHSNQLDDLVTISDAHSMIYLLLNKKPSKRICSLDMLKNHNFFNKFDFVYNLLNSIRKNY